MHYPPVNGLGFIGPPGAAEVTSGGIPIVSYTSTSGWSARPILATGYYQPTVVATGDPVAPQYDSGVPSPIAPPGGNGGYGTGLTREQILEMIARAKEFEAGQYAEGGDGYDYDLETQAGIDAARERALRDAAGMTVPGADEKMNWIPLVVADSGITISA